MFRVLVSLKVQGNSPTWFLFLGGDGTQNCRVNNAGSVLKFGSKESETENRPRRDATLKLLQLLQTPPPAECNP